MSQVRVGQAPGASSGTARPEGLTNERAWAMADRLDETAQGMEGVRRKISIAVGQW
jgi:hypothetical protein